MAWRVSSCFAVLLGCAALAASPASAATEIGSDCEADYGQSSGVTALQVARITAPSALKTTAPGVVTAWKVRTAPFLVEPRTQILKVFNQIGPDYLVVAESSPGIVLGGKLNQFPTRIPVASGVNFGVWSSSAVPACLSIAGDTLRYFNGNPLVGGGGQPPGSTTEALVALAVVIEPDADGDGYGDETQDQCPQSAATQGACPAPPPGGGVGASVKLKGKPKLEGNVVAVKLTTSAAAKVTVTGSIRGKAAAAPASKTVSPGETGRLYLTLKKSVKQRLANLPRKGKLKMVVEAKVAGSPTVSTEISLPGRKKPSAR